MSCRIKNIVPKCGYVVDGIETITALDFEDLNGLRFENDALYDTCLIAAVLRSGDFIEIDAPTSAKYSSTLQNGIYTHVIETFIGELSAEMSRNLHLATRRRHFIIFRSRAGRFFSFGNDAGATLTYANQTADGTGALVTITASSTYPLFEVHEGASNAATYISEFVPDFTNGAYCETDE